MNRLVRQMGIVAAACAAVLATPAGVATVAAQQDDWCQSERWGNNDRAQFCEVREFTVAATSGALSVEGTNGGISVEGEARGNVHILAKVATTAETQQRAREIASAVRLNPNLEQVVADGPEGLRNREGWSVSYRITVPRALNLSLRTSNGGITVRDVDSRVEFRTTNGGVKLIGLAGDVKGQTTNGGIDIQLDGQSWNGEGLDVQTSNGGVKLAIPEHYNARLEASTDNGGFHSDFPGAVAGRRGRNVSLQLGSGGAPITVRTSNGGVRVTRK